MLMKNFTQKAKRLLCLLLTLIGVQAYAQETISVAGVDVPVVDVQTVEAIDQATVGYSGITAEFNVAQVTEALGVASITEAVPYIVNVTTGEAVENTTDGWRNGDGDLFGWSDITEETRGYCVKIQEPESGLIDYLGAHHNGVWNVGDTFTGTWAFVANDKAALVKVVVTFVEPEETPDEPIDEIVLPEAETDITKLEIVGRISHSIDRYYTQGYETTSISFPCADMAEKLGTDAATLQQALAKMTYVDQYADGTNTGILNLLTVTDGWMRKVLTADGDETNQVCGAMYSGDCDIFIQQMAYDEENNVSYILGQMPGKMELGFVRYAELYIVYGSKAYIITQTVNFVEPPYNGLEDMTKVGETEVIKVSQQPTNDYSFVVFNLDLDAIAEQLGCEDPKDVQMQALDDMGGLSDQHTANNGGWWLNNMGTVCEWANGTFFIEPSANATWTEFHVGQKPEMCKAGDEYVAKLYLTYSGKYYEVEVHFAITDKEEVVDPDELHVVAERTITINQEVNNSYGWSEGVGISYEVLEETIGTTDVHLYGEMPDVDPEEKGFYTDEYTCDPKPGFWLTAEGKRTNWGGPSPWGMSIVYQTSEDAVIFNCIQFPDATKAGETYTGSFYLANTENASMLKVNVIYNIVESIEDIDVIGEQDLVLMVADQEFAAEIEGLDEIIANLGLENADELASATCMRALTSAGTYCNAVEPENGFTFDADGFVAEDENVGLYFNGVTFVTYVNETAPQNWKAKTDICLENNGKRYIFHVTFVSTDLYEHETGLNAIVAGSAAKTYDLLGREVKAARKGLLIRDGQKFIVK